MLAHRHRLSSYRLNGHVAPNTSMNSKRPDLVLAEWNLASDEDEERASCSSMWRTSSRLNLVIPSWSCRSRHLRRRRGRGPQRRVCHVLRNPRRPHGHRVESRDQSDWSSPIGFPARSIMQPAHHPTPAYPWCQTPRLRSLPVMTSQVTCCSK